jgi:MFS transporter, DHA1 family, multidrug resistance protein
MKPMKQLPFTELEFVILMSSLGAMTALSIDMMMPALPAIGQDLGVQFPNDKQLIISFLMLGISIGMLFFGPLSDSLGRKPQMIIGIALFIVGCVISIVAQDLPVMLLGRCLQGIGLGAPRALTISIIRDQYQGDAMARIMSFIFMIFILAPMVAPALGQAVLLVASWQWIFIILLLTGLILLFWFQLRQPETLKKEDRQVFSISQFFKNIKLMIYNPTALGYSVASGFISGAFLGYLSTAQQIFQEQYALGYLFPLIFAILSFSIGLASLINAKLVMHFGMRRLSTIAVLTIFLIASVFLIPVVLLQGHPTLIWMMVFMMIILFCTGILFSNLSSMAMEPLGKISGYGSTFVGTVSSLITVPVGIMIGRFYSGTVTPLVIGFLLFGGIFPLIVMRWVRKHEQFQLH